MTVFKRKISDKLNTDKTKNQKKKRNRRTTRDNAIKTKCDDARPTVCLVLFHRTFFWTRAFTSAAFCPAEEHASHSMHIPAFISSRRSKHNFCCHTTPHTSSRDGKKERITAHDSLALWAPVSTDSPSNNKKNRESQCLWHDYKEAETPLFRQPVQYNQCIHHRQGIGMILHITTVALDVYCNIHCVFRNSLRRP